MDKHPTGREPDPPVARPYGGAAAPPPVRADEDRTLLLQREGGLPGEYYGRHDEIDLWEHINVVLRRRWTVLAVFVVCLLSALLLTFSATPLYTATALLKIKPGGPNVTDFEGVQESIGQAQAYNDFYQTQYDILASRTLARRTIDTLDLHEDPYINGDLARASLSGRVMAGIRSFKGGDEFDPLRAEMKREQRVVNRFLEEVQVKPRRKSFLVELMFSSPDPDLSKAVAQTMAQEYIDLTMDQTVDAASQARNFIRKHLAKIKGSLEESEEALQEFARGQDIIALEQEERVIDARLADLNDRYTAVESERIALNALYNQTKIRAPREISMVVNNSLIKALRQELSSAQAERAANGARFTDEFPLVRRMDARIARLRESIGAEEARLIASIHTDYAQAVEREALLGDELTRQKTVVAAYEEKAVAFKIYQREVETNRSIYENLLHRMKEVEVAEAIRASNITLVDAPEVPLEPSSPNLPVNLALSMLLGLFGGVGMAFFQEYMDDSLKTPDDVERYLHLPTLGTIPEFAPQRTKLVEGVATEADLQVVQQPTSAGSEAIRTLRASLFLAAPGGLPNRLLLTSARPSEGKTCIAVNLAIALAQMGRKVCIIDCDLRRPRVNKALVMSLSPGLTNVLTGNMSIDEIVRTNVQPGLDVITAGPIPPNPVDLLNSANMVSVLEQLEERYDHVLVDAPPALGFADVPILTSQPGGGCLLVTRSGLTSKRLAKQACDYLIRMQTKMLGVVLNRVSTKSAGYSYYGYYGYYGDYYAKHQEDEPLKVESAV